MSRIFEALQKTGGEAADMVLPLAAGRVPTDGAESANGQHGSAERPPSAPEYRTVRLQTGGDSLLFPFDEGGGHTAEQYRIIRTKLLHHPLEPRWVAITSPELGDGKSITAANIAGALSLKPGTSVLLVDADLRRSSLRRLLGLSTSEGLAEVLTGACTLDTAIVRLECLRNLCFLPAGKRPPNPAELFDSPGWSAVCGELRRRFSIVIVDGPPMGMVADGDLIQAAADAIILVIRPDHTHRGMCYKALETIPPQKLLGVVMNSVPDWFLSRTAGYRHYEYYDPPDPEEENEISDSSEAVSAPQVEGGPLPNGIDSSSQNPNFPPGP